MDVFFLFCNYLHLLEIYFFNDSEEETYFKYIIRNLLEDKYTHFFEDSLKLAIGTNLL